MLTICPNCHQPLFDLTASACQGCGMKGSMTETVDATALAGLLYNLQLRLVELASHEFQQILGVLGPRPGHSETDGIPFTDETCRRTHQYLLDHGIRCTRIDFTLNHKTERSLVVARTQLGIERCVRQARKLALRTRGRLEIAHDTGATT